MHIDHRGGTLDWILHQPDYQEVWIWWTDGKWCLPLVARHFGDGLLKNLKSLKYKENIEDLWREKLELLIGHLCLLKCLRSLLVVVDFLGTFQYLEDPGIMKESWLKWLYVCTYVCRLCLLQMAFSTLDQEVSNINYGAMQVGRLKLWPDQHSESSK